LLLTGVRRSHAVCGVVSECDAICRKDNASM
jgi:hypothetical protein